MSQEKVAEIKKFFWTVYHDPVSSLKNQDVEFRPAATPHRLLNKLLHRSHQMVSTQTSCSPLLLAEQHHMLLAEWMRQENKLSTSTGRRANKKAEISIWPDFLENLSTSSSFIAHTHVTDLQLRGQRVSWMTTRGL